MKIEEVLKRHKKNLMAITGIAGVGQGICDGKPCIIVFVVRDTPGLADKIPENLGGYEVKIKETGVIGALPENRRR